MGNKRKRYSMLLVGLVLILATSVMACAKPTPVPAPTPAPPPPVMTPAPTSAPVPTQQAPTPTLTQPPTLDESKVHFEQGNIYLNQEQWDKAIAEYTKSIELNPVFANAYAKRALASLLEQEYNQTMDCLGKAAIQDAEKAFELNPAVELDKRLARAYVFQGDCYHFNMDYEESLIYYTKALELDPSISCRRPIDVYGELINDSLTYGEYDKAIEYANKAIELNTGYSDYYYRQLAEAYYGRGDYYHEYGHDYADDAIADYTKAIELDPTNAKYYLSRANTYGTLAFSHYAWGRVPEQVDCYNKAIADYTKAIELNPDAGGAYFGRGDIYALGIDYTGVIADYNRAIADYTKVIELGRLSSSVYWSRAIAYAKLGNTEKALTNYEKALELSEYASTKEYILIDIEKLKEQEQQDTAILEYKKATELNPQSAKAYALLAHAHFTNGILYSVSGAYQLAIANYNRAIELNPIKAAYYYGRGWAYSELCEHDLAIADYTESIKLDPVFAPAYNKRGDCYAKKGDHGKAIADHSRAIELDPESDQYYYNRGFSYAALVMNDEALSDFRKFLTLSDDEESNEMVRGWIEELQSD